MDRQLPDSVDSGELIDLLMFVDMKLDEIFGAKVTMSLIAEGTSKDRKEAFITVFSKQSTPDLLETLKDAKERIELENSNAGKSRPN